MKRFFKDMMTSFVPLITENDRFLVVLLDIFEAKSILMKKRFRKMSNEKKKSVPRLLLDDSERKIKRKEFNLFE